MGNQHSRKSTLQPILQPTPQPILQPTLQPTMQPTNFFAVQHFKDLVCQFLCAVVMVIAIILCVAVFVIVFILIIVTLRDFCAQRFLPRSQQYNSIVGVDEDIEQPLKNHASRFTASAQILTTHDNIQPNQNTTPSAPSYEVMIAYDDSHCDGQNYYEVAKEADEDNAKSTYLSKNRTGKIDLRGQTKKKKKMTHKKPLELSLEAPPK